MKNLKSLIGTSLLLLCLQSCNNNNPQPQSDLYVEAYYDTDDVGPYTFLYFKNGIPYAPSLVRTGQMFVEGDDVYFPSQGGYLKNGSLITLPGAGEISSIFVKNGLVYATGISEGRAAYWTGTQLTPIEPDSAAPYWRPKKIVVANNNDVHLAGNVIYPDRPNARQTSIFHWSNNTLDTLVRGTFLDLAVKGTDVFIVGLSFHQQITGYWKNGVNQTLTGINGEVVRSCAHVSVWDNDVYVVASGAGTLYWKNNQPVSAISSDINPVALVVDNGNVIVGINRETNHFPAVLYDMEVWKGNVVQPMGVGILLGMHVSN